MQRSILAAASVLILSSIGSAGPLEAQLSSIRGNVLVDRGNGFAPISGVTQLVVGNRVLVSGEGTAVLTYGPGCSVPLAPDSLTTFTGTESCVIGTQGTSGNKTNLMLLGSVGGALGATGFAIGSSLSDEGDDEPQS